ncbi:MULTISPECIES: hypothetical protein [Paenibacillaceae]|nr:MULTISPECIES: hypothetical protein [Paenibacillaceae]
MPSVFDKLVKTEEEIKQDVISDFTSALLSEIQKLVEKYGKEGLKEMLK